MVFIKSAEGSSYAEVLKKLKNTMKPETLGLNIKGVLLTGSSDILIEARNETEGRAELIPAISEAVRNGVTVHKLVLHIEVKILDLDSITQKLEVRESVKKHFGETQPGQIKFSLTKKGLQGKPEDLCGVTLGFCSQKNLKVGLVF